MKHLTLCILGIIIFFTLTTPVVHATTTEHIYLFYGEGCPHCAKERALLQTLLTRYPTLSLHEFEIYYNADNAQLLTQVGKVLNIDSGGVPFLIIGNTPFVGYSESISPVEIEHRIRACIEDPCPDSIGTILGMTSPEAGEVKEPDGAGGVATTTVTIPIVGAIDGTTFSLPILAVLMGMLDGFNPCAMWTLLFLISLLLGMEDTRKKWLLGASFIVASASVYFVFMSAWLNLILFLGFVMWVRILIGVCALLGGAYSIKEFLNNPGGGCAITGEERRQRVFEKLKLIISQQRFLIALGGIIVLAVMVNLVELICSAGLPAVYTQILAMNELPSWQYYAYILLYIFFFMLDDLIVFTTAMLTLEMTGITTKYARYSRLVGGTVMLLIGLLLILKPELLMFG